MTWPVYVINMASNPRRMEKAAAILTAAGIDFQRFEAVVGREVSSERLAEVYDAKANARRFRNPLLPGEIGCYLSHIAIWEKMAAGEDAGAIILEDDFAAAPDLKTVLKALTEDPRSWHLVKLYRRRDRARNLQSEALCDGRSLATPYQVPNTTLGYVIRKEAAGHLLSRSVPFARPIDEDHKRFWEHGLDIRVVSPSPLTLSEESETGDTIAASRRKLRGGLVQAWKNFRYRMEYRMNLRRARKYL